MYCKKSVPFTLTFPHYRRIDTGATLLPRYEDVVVRVDAGKVRLADELNRNINNYGYNEWALAGDVNERLTKTPKSRQSGAPSPTNS